MYMDLAQAVAAARRAEVTFPATVSSNPRFFMGSRTHCMHEAFKVTTESGTLEIVDNVSLAPRVPVMPGDQIQVRGEFVPHGQHGPLVHWTHHDPTHHHADGFIRFHDQVYA
ncbi:MAG: hypothetical protein NVSMB31_12590 [Vulcanimicrobiaceae bacterium]